MKPSALSLSANFGPTPLSLQRSSGDSRCAVEFAMDRCVEHLARRYRWSRPPFTGEVSPLAAALAMAMCGRTGVLSVSVTRCRGRSRMATSTSATTMTSTHQ